MAVDVVVGVAAAVVGVVDGACCEQGRASRARLPLGNKADQRVEEERRDTPRTRSGERRMMEGKDSSGVELVETRLQVPAELLEVPA